MTRSAGAWNVPTLSAREWRSATDDVLGANGSCTWTKSNGARLQHVVERARDVERRRRRRPAPRRRERQQLADAEHAARRRRGRRTSPARISRRDSRTSSGERDGASTTIRCPRARELLRQRPRRRR